MAETEDPWLTGHLLPPGGDKWACFEQQCRLALNTSIPAYWFTNILFHLPPLWPWARVVSWVSTPVSEGGFHVVASNLINEPLRGTSISYDPAILLHDLHDVVRCAPFRFRWGAGDVLVGKNDEWAENEKKNLFLRGARVPKVPEGVKAKDVVLLPIALRLLVESSGSRNRSPLALRLFVILVNLTGVLPDLGEFKRERGILQSKLQSLLNSLAVCATSETAAITRLTPGRVGGGEPGGRLPTVAAARLSAPKWPRFKYAWAFTDRQRDLLVRAKATEPSSVPEGVRSGEPLKLTPPMFPLLSEALERQYGRIQPAYKNNDASTLSISFFRLVPASHVFDASRQQALDDWRAFCEHLPIPYGSAAARGAILEGVPVGAGAVARVARTGLSDFLFNPGADPDFVDAIPQDYPQQVKDAEMWLMKDVLSQYPTANELNAGFAMPLFLPELPRCFGVLVVFLNREQALSGNTLPRIADRLYTARSETQNALGQAYVADVLSGFRVQAARLFDELGQGLRTNSGREDASAINFVAAKLTAWLARHSSFPLIRLSVQDDEGSERLAEHRSVYEQLSGDGTFDGPECARLLEACITVDADNQRRIGLPDTALALVVSQESPAEDRTESPLYWKSIQEAFVNSFVLAGKKVDAADAKTSRFAASSYHSLKYGWTAVIQSLVPPPGQEPKVEEAVAFAEVYSDMGHFAKLGDREKILLAFRPNSRGIVSPKALETLTTAVHLAVASGRFDSEPRTETIARNRLEKSNELLTWTAGQAYDLVEVDGSGKITRTFSRDSQEAGGLRVLMSELLANALRHDAKNGYAFLFEEKENCVQVTIRNRPLYPLVLEPPDSLERFLKGPRHYLRGDRLDPYLQQGRDGLGLEIIDRALRILNGSGTVTSGDVVSFTCKWPVVGSAS